MLMGKEMSRLVKSKKQQLFGFTIVELIIVMVVIGILAAIGIVSYSSTLSRGKMNSAVSSANQVRLKLGEYYTDNNKYPASPTIDTNGPSVTTYLTSINSNSLVTEFNLMVGAVRKYQYVATPVGCNNAATTCTSYTITIPKAVWNSATDPDQVVSP